GMLIQVPDGFLREVSGLELPPAGAYAVGFVFLPTEDTQADEAVASIERIADEEELRVVGWRDVPTDPSHLGATAVLAMPRFRQLFVAGRHGEVGLGLERRAFCLRKRVEREAGVYLPSLSART